MSDVRIAAAGSGCQAALDAGRLLAAVHAAETTHGAAQVRA